MSTALKVTVATLATVAVLSNTTEAYRPAPPPQQVSINSLDELKKAHRARLAHHNSTSHHTPADFHHHHPKNVTHHQHHHGNHTRSELHRAQQRIAISEEEGKGVWYIDHPDPLGRVVRPEVFPWRGDAVLFDEDEEQGSGGINVSNGGWSGSVTTNGGFNGNVSGGWNGGRPTVGGGWSGSVGSGTGSVGIKNGPGGTSYGAGWTGTVGGGQFGANIGGGRGGLSGGVSWTKTFDEELDEVADALQGFGGFSGCICNNPQGCPC